MREINQESSSNNSWMQIFSTIIDKDLKKIDFFVFMFFQDCSRSDLIKSL